MEKEELEIAFADYCAEDYQKGLALITGLFVGLLEHIVEASGGDKNAQIKVEGGNRDIAVSAVYNAKVTSAPPTDASKGDEA